MFGQGMTRSRTAREEADDEIYAKARRRMLDGPSWGWPQMELQRALDRHSAAMERLAAALEARPIRKRK